MSSTREVFKAKIRIDRSMLFRLVLYIVFSLGLIVNSTLLRSPYVGILASVAILYMVSDVVGILFFPDEGPVLQKMLGFAAFVVLLVFACTGLILIAKFTELLSLVVVVALGLIFHLSYFFSSGDKSTQKIVHATKKEDESLESRAETYALVLFYLIMVGVSFYALFMGRTGEGRTSVWLTIPDFFLPAFFLSALFLAFTLFMTRIDAGIKIVLVILFSLLAHSLFMMVWYPGRYGDPWVHLGEARFIDATGAPYAYAWLLIKSSLLDLIAGKAQYALVVLFTRILALDIYWVHIAFIPFFWSFFASLASYKIADLLTTSRNKTIPLLAAASTLIFPDFIIWGAVSVPNSVGFIFFFFTIFLTLYWINKGTTKIWMLALLAALTSGLAHPQAGIFAVVFFLVGTIFQKVSRRFLKIALYIALLALYPLALYVQKATFSFDGLLLLDNFLAFQSGTITLQFVLAILGLVSFLWLKSVRGKSVFVLFVFYATVLIEYYLTTYGMKNLPFGSGRILTVAEFIMVPFIAFGLFTILALFRKTLQRAKVSFFGRFHMNPKGHIVAVLLICVFLASQTTLTLYQTYPRKEIVDIQPAAYEVEAIDYIDSSAPDKYVVLGDPQFAGLAVGLLGADYTYGAGRGLYGGPEFWYPTVKLYSDMTKAPSLSILKDAMKYIGAEAVYFVVSIRASNFEDVVLKTSDLLPVDHVFGDGELYVFKYPLPVIEGTGPSVKVTFENGSSMYVESRFSYMFKSEVSYFIALSGHSSYNITDYPYHWAFTGVTVGLQSVPFNEASNVNEFIYIDRRNPAETVNVAWQADDNNPIVKWKDESFKSGWQTHHLYGGTIKPTIGTDGNILAISWDFSPGIYQYYYYENIINLSPGGNQSLVVRWKSTGSISIAAIYFGPEARGQQVVAAGSQSSDWSRTIVRVPSGEPVFSVMVGISNLADTKISGVFSLYIDYIMISAPS
jgi:hypothetical protein